MGRIRYSGNPRHINASMLRGPTYGGMATGGYLGTMSVGGSYSRIDEIDYFSNFSFGIGLGYGFFIGAQY